MSFLCIFGSREVPTDIEATRAVSSENTSATQANWQVFGWFPGYVVESGEIEQWKPHHQSYEETDTENAEFHHAYVVAVQNHQALAYEKRDP